MSKQKNYEVIRENELGYLQTGDYFIPDLKLPQENRSIGNTVACIEIICRSIIL